MGCGLFVTDVLGCSNKKSTWLGIFEIFYGLFLLSFGKLCRCGRGAGMYRNKSSDFSEAVVGGKWISFY